MSVAVSTEQTIYQGTLQWAGGAVVPFDVRFLGAADLPDLEAFRDRIFAALPDIDAYYPEAPEFVGSHLAERGRTLGVLSQGRMVGCAVLGIPDAGMPNFVDDLQGQGHAIDPLSVAHMCSCMVDPELRGQGLQRLLVAMRVLLAIGLGRPNLMTRVAVINHVSLANMIACGFVVRRVIVMHGTRLRYVLHRDMASPPVAWAPDSAIAVPLADTQRQRELLSDGLTGVALTGPAHDRRILLAPSEGTKTQCRVVRSSSMLTPPVC
jgi:ribosomal protein S18 acetylase RimI-like enzyme